MTISSCICPKRALPYPLFSRLFPLLLCSSQAALGAPLPPDAILSILTSFTPDQPVIMPSDKAGHRHAYKKSTDNLRSAQSPTQTRSSSSGSQTQTPTPRRRPSTLLRNASASNADDKRHAQTKATTTTRASSCWTPPVRPSPVAPAPRNTDRDSFHSILEDPFFQEYDPSSVDNLPTESPRDQHTAGPTAQGDEWEAHQRSTRPRRESLTIGSSQASQLWVCPHK